MQAKQAFYQRNYISCQTFTFPSISNAPVSIHIVCIVWYSQAHQEKRISPFYRGQTVRGSSLLLEVREPVLTHWLLFQTLSPCSPGKRQWVRDRLGETVCGDFVGMRAFTPHKICTRVWSSKRPSWQTCPNY